MFVVDDITLIDCYSSYSTKYTELRTSAEYIELTERWAMPISCIDLVNYIEINKMADWMGTYNNDNVVIFGLFVLWYKWYNSFIYTYLYKCLAVLFSSEVFVPSAPRVPRTTATAYHLSALIASRGCLARLRSSESRGHKVLVFALYTVVKLWTFVCWRMDP